MEIVEDDNDIVKENRPNTERELHFSSVPSGADVYHGSFQNQGECSVGQTPLTLRAADFDTLEFTISMPADRYLEQLRTVPELIKWAENFEHEESTLPPDARPDYFVRLDKPELLCDSTGKTTHINASFRAFPHGHGIESGEFFHAFFVPANVSPEAFFPLMPPPGTYPPISDDEVAQIFCKAGFDPSVTSSLMEKSPWFTSEQVNIAVQCLTRCGHYDVVMKGPLRLDAALRKSISLSPFGGNMTTTSWRTNPTLPCTEAVAPLSLEMLYIDSIPFGAHVYAGNYANKDSKDDPEAAGEVEYLGITPLRIRAEQLRSRFLSIVMPIDHLEQAIRSQPNLSQKLSQFAAMRHDDRNDCGFFSLGTIMTQRSWKGEKGLHEVSYCLTLRSALSK